MSPSTKSKPASDSSPETGDATEDGKATASDKDKDKDSDEDRPPRSTVEIELEVSRQRAVSWTVFGIIFGSLLIWKLGTVGVWAGVMLVVLGVFRAYELVQTFLHPPGTIVVGETEIVLPRGLCMGTPVKAPRSDVTSVYFLRRSVPWNRSAPVLVVELGARAFAFPRDWFASEADQRHVVHALLRGIEGAKASPDKQREPHQDDGRTIMWAQLVGGLLLLGGGIGAWTMASTPISTAQYALFVAPIVAGWIFAWRGLMRW
ncbi:MAG: hypothetical protein ACKV2T_05085 [Kofleriaceae bacterium]